MDGLLFYWISWFGWIITTFFFPKNYPNRLLISAWLLLAIIFSSFSYKILGFNISGTGLLVLITIYIYAGQLEKKKSLYFFLCSFILMLSTVSFLLFELYDPIWIFFDRKWLLGICTVCLTVLLYPYNKNRIIILLFGMIHGELLYSYIVRKYSFSYPVATLYSLDALAVSVGLLVLWNGLESFTSIVYKPIHTTEKEKSKLT